MRAFILAIGFSLTLTGAAAAHDFWLQPATFRAAPGEATPITLQVGHGRDRQRSPIPLRRVVRFTAHGPGGETRDVSAGLHPGMASEDGAVRLPRPGAYVLALETDATAQSHLTALRYNDYLQVEGLTPALDLRMRTHRMDADGSENYRRCAKALVQVGPARGASPEVTRPVGLALEIVPEANPYGAARLSALPVRVIFEGRPLAGALVKLTNLDHDEAPVESHRSDTAGRAVFAMPPAGRWQMNVIWTKPLPRDRETDFETSFSSLAFGVGG